MYLLDQIEKFEKINKDEPNIKDSEYEILSRVHLTGVLEYPGIYFQFWEFPIKGFGEEKNKVVRASYLKILEISPSSQEQNTRLQTLPPKNKQYYIPKGIANEIAILMTLFTRSHFIVSRQLKTSGIIMMAKYYSNSNIAHSDMDGREFSLVKIQKMFDLLKGLKMLEDNSNNKVRRIEPFMLAAMMYQLGVSLIEFDESLAYINLVSSIESLLHDFNITNLKIRDINPTLENLIRRYVSDNTGYKEIETELLKHSPKKKQRFVKFILDHLTDKFWNDDTRPKKDMLKFKDSSQIEEYLKRIYDARSLFLHNAQLFPPEPFVNAEIPLGLGMSVGKKSWTKKELLPHVKAFERIVHHVLIEYLRRESKIGFEKLQKNENSSDESRNKNSDSVKYQGHNTS